MFAEFGLASMMLLSASPNTPTEDGMFVAGECVLTVVNQHSVHPGTKVSVREADGSDMIVLEGVEDEAGLVTTAPFMVDDPDGLSVHVSAGPSGVTSLVSEDVSCVPVEPEPAPVEKPATEPVPEVPAPTAPPVSPPVTEPVVTPETVPQPAEPAPEPSTPEPVDEMNTPDRPELALTGIETAHITAAGSLLLAAGAALTAFTRKIV